MIQEYILQNRSLKNLKNTYIKLCLIIREKKKYFSYKLNKLCNNLKINFLKVIMLMKEKLFKNLKIYQMMKI